MKFHQNPRVVRPRETRTQRSHNASAIPPKHPRKADNPSDYHIAARAGSVPKDPWLEVRLGSMVLMVLALITVLAG